MVKMTKPSRGGVTRPDRIEESVLLACAVSSVYGAQAQLHLSAMP